MPGVIIVTGASRGIGAATARLLGRGGHAVCVTYRRRADAAAAVVAAIEADGGRALAARADVAAADDVAALFATVDRDLGPLTGLVNNAGIIEPHRRVRDMDTARLRRVLEVNVLGAFLCAREAVRRMSTRDGGRGGAIVNVSSMAAVLGSPGEYVDYAASKGAIDTFTVGLAREVAAEGIRVNAVRPGLIETGIHAGAGMPDRVARLQSGVPMRRGGAPDEVARLIVWLLSDEASYVTGAKVDVSGGR